MALGATNVQVCTAIMHYGFRIVQDMNEGLSTYLDSKGMKSLAELVGKSVRNVNEWKNLDLNFQRVARIDYDKCIGCNLCYIACEDGAHQCIDLVAPESINVDLGPGRVLLTIASPWLKSRTTNQKCLGANFKTKWRAAK